MARLLAVNVGLPQNIQWRGEIVYTGIWKYPIQGRCAARRLNLEGDGQGDLAGHGGEQRAVMVYQIDSYQYWERTLSRSDFTFGQFSENFTVEGLPDDKVCIGDRYRIGGALFEVTQPRVTCYRVGIRMNDPHIPALLVAHHRPGFYFRVLEEGEVGAGDEIVKVAEGPERFTVADIDALLYLPGHRPDQLQRALRIPALSPGWRGSFEALAAQEAGSAPAAGNPGLSRAAGPPPAWPGFRPLRAARVERESAGVISLTLESEDGSPLPPALPGQFLVLRLRSAANAPALLRNYSISGAPDAGTYRVSVKQEVNGKGSSFLHTQSRVEMSWKSARQEEASPCSLAKDLWCCSVPGSARLRSWPCSMPWQQAGPRAKSGGCTAREMRPIIPLPARRAISPPHSRTSEASSLTANRLLAIGSAMTTTRRDA